MSIEQAVAAQPADSATPVAPARRLAVTFTGSGSEYFRIWIVNLLLTLLSLSLYYPFAKARRLAYFHGNTLVDGLPLGFHGNPRKMLRGHLLMLVLGAAYAVAIRFSPLSAAVALVVIAAVWPALWRAALQFRMANTSWRGLRMRFGGTLGGAYRALLPVFLPGTAIFLAGAMAPESQVMDPESAQRLMWLVLGVMLVSLLASPLLLLAIKRYQHGGYRLARDTSRLETRAGAFYMLSLKSIGVTLASVALAMVIMAGLFYVVREQLSSEGPVRSAMMFAPIALAYLLMFVIPWPYWAARLQNLVWSQTRSEHLQFHSALSARALVWLTLKNLMLTLLTLGLYRPFAAVATARLRLDAVSLELSGDVDEWLSGLDQAAAQDAAGDLAGDFFGIDLGL